MEGPGAILALQEQGQFSSMMILGWRWEALVSLRSSSTSAIVYCNGLVRRDEEMHATD